MKLHDIQKRVVQSEQWLLAWIGGQITDVFKNNGSREECDASRGILLSDHSRKSLCKDLYDNIMPLYESRMPRDQFGAVSGRSTDFATHIVRSLFDNCHSAALSFFILFVDLAKAFDRIVREIVFGFPSSQVQNSFDFLVGLRLTEEQAAWFVEFLDKYGQLFDH